MRLRLLFVFFLSLLLLLFILNMSIGSVSIPFGDVVSSLLGMGESKDSWKYIVVNYRFPKALVAIFVGIALSISGLMMQTLFRNPMAESYVLGVSSGAGLGVAVLIFGSAFLPGFLSVVFTSVYGIAFASILGSLAVLFLILLVSSKVRSTITVLIVGLMFGSFVNAVVSILSFFGSGEQLKRFSLWSLGGLGNLPSTALYILGAFTFLGMLLALVRIKALDALLLGDNYAKTMGVNIKSTRNYIILLAALLTGVCTAFVGPIAFVGLAVPHMARIVFKTHIHRVLLLGSALLGASLMLLCDTLTQVGGDHFILPINAITSLFGAPVVIWLILKNRVMS